MPNLIRQKFLSDQAGNIAVMTTLLMPIVIGGFALAGEVSYWYFTKLKLQNAADVAAHAGAIKLRSDQDLQPIEVAAEAAAIETGYNATIGAITTNWPATTGAFAGDAGTVETTVTENLPRLFTSLFLNGKVPISGHAVAQLKKSFPICIIALDPSASGAVTFTGSADATLENCNVHANSLADDAVLVTGSAKVKTPCVSSVGKVSATSGLTMGECNLPVEHADLINDPYEDVPEPSTSGACALQNVFEGPPSARYTISAGRYCGGLTIKRTVTMNPGVYVIDGGSMKVESTAVVKGTGVTLFLTNGAKLSVAGTANIQLSAPKSGTYAGILVFVDRDDPYAAHVVNGDSSSAFNGAIYAPAGHVEFAGSSSIAGGCTRIVADTIEITGSTGIGSNCTGSGFNEIKTEQLVTLVE